MNRPSCAVLGAGTWGSGMARLLAQNGSDVVLWSHRKKRVHPAAGTNEHAAIALTDKLEQALAPELVFVAISPAYVRGVMAKAAKLVRPEHRFVHVVRGFEPGGTPISQVIDQETCAILIAAMAGPMDPEELLQGEVSAAVVGCPFQTVIDEVTEVLAGSHLRVYGSSDRIGVEVGGAMRAPLALAAGIVQELTLGRSSTAVLLTRALAETADLIHAMGGSRETAHGLSGIGDWMHSAYNPDEELVLLGRALAKGHSCDHPDVHERVTTLVRLADERRLALPITRAVHAVLEGKDLHEALRGLMLRPTKKES